MALTREKKESILEKITGIFTDAKAIVFVRFHGVSVADALEMRKKLRAQGVGYMVVKKTLVKRVLGAMGLKGVEPKMEGEAAIAYPLHENEKDSEVAPAKGIAEFMKKFDERVLPFGGIFESTYLGKEEVLALSRIPSRRALYGQFVTVLNSPIQGTVSVFSGVMRSFAVALSQITEKKVQITIISL